MCTMTTYISSSQNKAIFITCFNPLEVNQFSFVQILASFLSWNVINYFLIDKCFFTLTLSFCCMYQMICFTSFFYQKFIFRTLAQFLHSVQKSLNLELDKLVKSGSRHQMGIGIECNFISEDVFQKKCKILSGILSLV